MGKGTVISHLGNGLYNVRIDKDTAGYDRNIADATARLLALDNDEIPAAVTRENDKEIAYGGALISLDAAIVVFNAVPNVPEDAKNTARQVLGVQQGLTQTAFIEWEDARLALRRALNEKNAAETYKTSQEQLRAVAVAGDVRNIWMADLTTTKVFGDEVGLFDIPNETFNNKKVAIGKPLEKNTAIAVIRPASFAAGNEVYSAVRDGIEQAASGAIPSGAQTFWNWAVKPAWVIGKPTARVAEILSVNYGNDTADVRVLNIDSWVRNFQTKPLGQEADTNEYGIYRNVAVEYMTCNARAFAEKDRVIVEFEGQSEVVGVSTGPRVVGFESNPRECTTDGFNYTRFNIVSPYVDLNDVGAGWVIDTTGTPTVVDGNIDVQTHGNTRATGGLVPDPIRFNGPYRRHIPQLMDPTLEVAPQPVLWGVHWYAGRTIAGTCIGNILGIGSQDDVGGTTTYAIAAVDESTVPGSGAPTNTIGFYRRQYDGDNGFYTETTNVTGWRKVGSYTFAEGLYEGHDLPVFFNASGTKAVHVRYKKAVTSTGTFQARATKGDNAEIPTLIDLTKPRMFDTEMVEWTFALDFVTAPTSVVTAGGMSGMAFTRTEDTPGNDISPQTTFTQLGAYIIGAEYLDDLLTVCRYRIDHTEVNKVVTSRYQALPWEHAGEKFYNLDINNRLEFETLVGGTAEVPVLPDGINTLKDTTAGFMANDIKVGMAINNTTTMKSGTIVEIVDNDRIRTSVLLAEGEAEISPAVASQFWTVGNTYTINTTSNKSIPITLANWHTKQVFDTRGETTLDGVPFSSFQANSEFDTSVWSVATNGATRWFQAALAFLDPRYGTAILDIHRLDGGDPFDTTNFQIIPGASNPVAGSSGTFYSPSHLVGVEHAYFGVYSKWGEVGKLEWTDEVIAETGQEKTDSFAVIDKYILENTYATFQTPIGLYNYWNNEPVPAYYSRVSDGEFWPYEAGELSELGSLSREFQQQPVGMYQGQYQLLSSSLRFERDRTWPTMPSTIGYYEWTDNTSPIEKLFAYWYGGNPSQWRASEDANWQMSDSWGIFGPTSTVGMRSFTASLQGFTSEPLPVVPMFGHCATTDGNDVMFSGFLVVDVILADGSAEVTLTGRYAFLSGEGSNLGTLRTLLGGTPDQWFPLGVALRN